MTLKVAGCQRDQPIRDRRQDPLRFKADKSLDLYLGRGNPGPSANRIGYLPLWGRWASAPWQPTAASETRHPEREHEAARRCQ